MSRTWGEAHRIPAPSLNRRWAVQRSGFSSWPLHHSQRIAPHFLLNRPIAKRLPNSTGRQAGEGGTALKAGRSSDMTERRPVVLQIFKHLSPILTGDQSLHVRDIPDHGSPLKPGPWSSHRLLILQGQKRFEACHPGNPVSCSFSAPALRHSIIHNQGYLPDRQRLTLLISIPSFFSFSFLGLLYNTPHSFFLPTAPYRARSRWRA